MKKDAAFKPASKMSLEEYLENFLPENHNDQDRKYLERDIAGRLKVARIYTSNLVMNIMELLSKRGICLNKKGNINCFKFYE